MNPTVKCYHINPEISRIRKLSRHVEIAFCRCCYCYESCYVSRYVGPFWETKWKEYNGPTKPVCNHNNFIAGEIQKLSINTEVCIKCQCKDCEQLFSLCRYVLPIYGTTKWRHIDTSKVYSELWLSANKNKQSTSA